MKLLINLTNFYKRKKKIDYSVTFWISLSLRLSSQVIVLTSQACSQSEMCLKSIHLWVERELHSVDTLVYLLAQFLHEAITSGPAIRVASVTLLMNISIPTTCRMTVLSTALS